MIMKAIILSAIGSVDNLKFKDMPVPAPQNGEVLIKVQAISINPVDIKTRTGGGVYRYGNVSQETELILGWDISGIVTESKSTLFKVGDEVFGMVNFPGAGKAYAEYVTAPASHLALKPDNITHQQAAAATLASLTAWQVLAQQANVRPGQRVLIHAASGGVGHYAVQLARHLGAYVIGTSSAANKDFVLSLGADEHIDYQSDILSEVTGNIDFVLDCLGTENILQSLSVIKDGGKIISIVSQFTDELKQQAEAKNISGDFYLVHSDGNDMRTLAALLREGKLKSHVSKTFRFEDMADAHKQIESGRTVGKVVVNV
jgi:NADPH:quinone reductase-like Zn-dependent oxidoreductase